MKVHTVASIGLVGLFVFGVEACTLGRSQGSRDLAHHLRPRECAIMTVNLGVTRTDPGGTALMSFPVYVHYMVNVDHPGDDPSTSSTHLNTGLLHSYLAQSGPFNAVWVNHGIGFVLAGVEKCTYSLTKYGYQAERPSLPDPAADMNLLHKIFDHYNVTHYQVSGPGTSSGTLPVRKTSVLTMNGLDLYIWWNIQNRSGYGSSPKFGPQGNTTEKGGVFLDNDCLAEPAGPNGLVACGRLFAHEVGHFFALCHACSTAVGSTPQWPTCTTSYCPDVVTAPSTVPACASPAPDRLMADNWQTTGLTPCEITRAKQYAQQILHQ